MNFPRRIVQVTKPISPAEVEALQIAMERWQRWGGTLILPPYAHVTRVVPLMNHSRRYPSLVAHTRKAYR